MHCCDKTVECDVNAMFIELSGEIFAHFGHCLPYLGRVDADRRGGAVGLVALDALDVDHELLAVRLDDLADGVALVVATDDLRENVHIVYIVGTTTTQHTHTTRVEAPNDAKHT